MRTRISLGAMLIAAASAAVAKDQVTSLPGWNGNLITDMYSGYLNIPGGKHLHYVFIESQGNPKTDPVVIFLNGGPGCSSMEGMLDELGPYHIVPGSNPPVLYQNPYSWNNISNLLFIESPAGVGFSYADTPSGLIHNDTSTAIDNLNALLAFYSGFSEYLPNDLYISGESYAGVYVPTFAYAIVQYNNQQSPSNRLPLRGIAVGNGCIGTEAGVCGEDPFGMSLNLDQWRGHGLVSATLYARANKLCGDYSNPTPDCYGVINKIADDIGHINVYGIYLPCINSGFPPSSSSSSDEDVSNAALTADEEALLLSRQLKADGSATTKADIASAFLRQAQWWSQRGVAVPHYPTSNHRRPVSASTPTLGGPDECIDAGDETLYLNQPEVRAALHVVDIPWIICTGNITYTPTEPDLRQEVYPTLIEKAGLRVLIYNGETDACVPYTDNEWWTSSMNYTVVSPWHVWMTDNDDVAGYVTQYAHNFTFTTIRGAGHMVPQTQPEAAWIMINKFLNKLPWY